MTTPVFVLGGYQTDFARKWSRERAGLDDIMSEVVQGTLYDADIDATAVEVGHVGNFAAEIFCGQGQLGGLLVEADKAFAGLPVSRHEAACASGSMAILAAMADIEAGRYDVALVAGAELMRNVSAFEAQRNLGAAAWVPRETHDVEYPWPQLFSDLGDEYERRYGLDHAHLAAIAQANYAAATRNPNAQTREWEFAAGAFEPEHDANPIVVGMIRRQDCSQVTDGGAGVILAGERFTRRWSERNAADLSSVPFIRGWGHATSRMALEDKVADSRGSDYVFPHVRKAISDAFIRSRLPGVEAVDTIECHDCFTTTEYMAIDHFGITPPGESWKAIEDGTIFAEGSLPLNPSGGLIGAGHPVGASGVRMLLDAFKQVGGAAGEYQVGGARRAATLNIGGSATTTACFVVDAARNQNGA